MPKKRSSSKTKTFSSGLVLAGKREVSLLDRACAEFDREIVFNRELIYTLNPERVARLQSFLEKIAPTEEDLKSSIAITTDISTRLFKFLQIACDYNDSEAIHVLLRGLQSDYPDMKFDESLTILQFIKLFAKSFSLPLEGKLDPVAIRLQLRFNKSLKERCNNFNREDLLVILRHDQFKVEYIQDAYLANSLLSVIKKWKLESELERHQQHLFVHACRLGFKEVLRFCFDCNMLPNVDMIPVVTDAHSPLAYYAFHSSANKEAVAKILLENNIAPASLSETCAFELLALCCYLNDEALGVLKAELTKHLRGKDIKSTAKKVLMGDLFFMVSEFAFDVIRDFNLNDFQSILVEIPSVSLFKWMGQQFGRAFQAPLFVKQLIGRFDQIRLSGISQDEVFTHFAKIFLNILPYFEEVDRESLEFILAVFIKDNNLSGVSLVKENFNGGFKLHLRSRFSAQVIVGNFDFSGLTLLSAALVCGSLQLAAMIYNEMIENNNPAIFYNIAPFGSELLAYLVNDLRPNANLILHCLGNVSGLVVDEVVRHKLFALCFKENSVNRLLLRKVVVIASHFLNDEFFNFRREEKFTADEFDDLALAAEALASGLQESEHQERLFYLRLREKLYRAKKFCELLEDPLKCLNAEDVLRVKGCELHDYYAELRSASTAKKDNLAELILRRIFLLKNTNLDRLQQELTILKEYQDKDWVVKFNIFGLFCELELYGLVELVLLICPRLKFSAAEDDEDYWQFFSSLSEKRPDIAKKFLNYVSRNGGSIPFKVELIQKGSSPIYFVASTKVIAIDHNAVIKELEYFSKSHFTDFDDTAILQLIAYIHYFVLSQSKISNIYKEVKFLEDLIRALRKRMVRSMLEVARELKDSTLISMALEYEPRSVLSGEVRIELVRILFLNPASQLIDALKLIIADVLEKQFYYEQGYLKPVDGLTVCLAQLELALLQDCKLLANNYCQLLIAIFKVSPSSTYQLATFIQLLYQFRLLVSAPSDINAIMTFCYDLLIAKVNNLSSVNFSSQLIIFIREVFDFYRKKDSQDIIKIKEILNLCEMRSAPSDVLPAQDRLPSVLTLSQMDSQKAINSLHENFRELSGLSGRDIIEYWVLVQRWLYDSVEVGADSLVQLCFYFLGCLLDKNINFISILRSRFVADSKMVVRSINGLMADQLSKVISGHDLDWLFNIAVSTLNIGLFAGIRLYLDKYSFSMDLSKNYVWMDASGVSKPLDKLYHFIGDPAQDQQCVIAILKTLLWTSYYQRDLAGLLEVMNLLKNLMSLHAPFASAEYMLLVEVARLSPGSLKELFEYSCQKDDEIFIGLLNLYGTQYPRDKDFLFADRSIYQKLLQKLNLLQEPLMKIFLDILEKNTVGQMIDLLDSFDGVILRKIKEFCTKKFLHAGLIDKMISYKEQYKDSFKMHLEQKLKTVDKELRRIADGLLSLRESDVTSSSEADIKEMLTSLNALKKNIGFEKFLIKNPAQFEEKMVALERTLSAKRAEISENHKKIVELERQQQALAAQAQEEKLVQQQQREKAHAEAEEQKKREKDAREQLEKQRILAAEAEKNKQEARKIERQAWVRGQVVEPLAILQNTVRHLHVNGSEDLIGLFGLKEKIKEYEEECLRALQLIGKQDRQFVNKTLSECKQQLAAMSKKLQDLGAEVDRSIQDLENRENKEEKKRAKETERERRRQQARQDEVYVHEKLEQPLFELQNLVKAIVIDAELDLESRCRLKEEIKKHQAKSREILKLADVQEDWRYMTDRVFKCKENLGVVLESLEELKNQLDKLEQEEEFYKHHQLQLIGQFNALASRVGQNPVGFYYNSAHVKRDPIVAVVVRAELKEDECGLKVKCINVDKFGWIEIEGGYDLYVLNEEVVAPGERRVKSGCCALYFNSRGDWTILQNGQVFLACKVQPLYPATVRLMYKNEDQEDREAVSVFMGGVLLKPATASRSV